ncbi:hypothetical protein BDZ45DRAFT_696080 [Acephala macrosclerotiorum]|nr:hypothetical protein BDZ45DRAFT_696080 [Acephala macrosclerotiorum]
MSDSNSQQESSPASSISLTTHDISRTKYHIDELGTFAARLENASASIFPNKGRSRYKDIRVLLLRWEEDNMGVQYELNDLAKTFKSTYGFDTEIWVIPTAKSLFALNRKTWQFIEDFGNADNLLIVYYAGRGLMNGSRQALWTEGPQEDKFLVALP